MPGSPTDTSLKNRRCHQRMPNGESQSSRECVYTRLDPSIPYRMTRQRVAPFFFLLGIFVLIGVISAQGCSSKSAARDLRLEQGLINILLAHKNDEISKIDLNKALGGEWRKICIQGPYATRDWFERETNEKLDGYNGLEKDSELFNNIWIFYKNNTSRFAQIHRGVVMDRFAGNHTVKQTLCTTTSNPFMYLIRQNGEKKFFLASKGE